MIKNIFIGLIIVVFFLFIGLGEYGKYTDFLKHFPDMTFHEYLCLEKRIRITPKDIKEE
jgi:hypothetical protein